MPYKTVNSLISFTVMWYKVNDLSDHREESVIAYRDWVQYKHRDGEGYYAFLKRIAYASAKDYIYKVRKIADQL